MAFVNTKTKEIALKIVYHGTGLGGKTTNLSSICKSVSASRRSDLLTLDTATERTLFFDFLLLVLGEIAGFKTYLHLYTVPGQIYYDASRKLILNGADALVFVVDSDSARMKDNIQSQQLLEKDLGEIGIDIKTIPMVVQFNKSDLPNRTPLKVLQAQFNPEARPHHEAIARHGFGVMETLATAANLAVRQMCGSSPPGAPDA